MDEINGSVKLEVIINQASNDVAITGFMLKKLLDEIVYPNFLEPFKLMKPHYSLKVLFSRGTVKYLHLVFTLFLFSAIAHADTDITLAQNGRSNYVIVLANDAIPAEKTAAQELQKYFLQMTDVTLPIKTESEVTANTRQILIGNSARVKVLLPDVDWNNIGKDGIVIQTVGDNLVLAGDRPRGSLYAVFQFLEDAGCRFWWPGAFDIPHKSTFTIAPQKLLYAPPFAYRQHSSAVGYGKNEEFATMLRLNGNRQPQTEAWGGHYDILGWVHTFSKLLPVEKYFKEHPEWYSDPDNGNKPATASSKMPSPQQTDLCLGNPQVLDAVTTQALAWIKENPSAGYISISQNDNRDSYCRDDYAMEMIEKEGSPSGPLLNFVNQVAEKIHQVYPDFLVTTLAYHWSEKPPKTIRPGKNVLIRLAPISSDYGHPLDSDANASVRDNLLAWEKISPQLFIWNYVTDFPNTLMPYPNMPTLGADLRFFANHKVTGVFEQGNSYTNDVGDFAPLRAYLISRLLWNPHQDQQQLTDEFLRGYYGAAAPYLQQYLTLIENSFPRGTEKLSTFNTNYSFLTLDVMNRATHLFDQAAAAVKDNSELSERVARERFSFNLAWLMRYRILKSIAVGTHSEFLGPQDPQQLLADWKTNAARWGVTAYGEHRSLDVLLKQLESVSAAPTTLSPLPDFAAALPAKDVIDIQPWQFDLSQKYGSIINDAATLGGKAARVDGATNAWAIKAWLNQLVNQQQLGDSSWKVVALGRVEMKPGLPQTGVGIQGGIYDLANRKSRGSIAVPLSQLADGKYHQIELGHTKLDGGMYIWVAPIDNPNVTAIYVDRIILMRQ